MATPLYKILIVDDDLLVQSLITDILVEDESYDVKMASSGEEALLVLRDFNPDIIILDIEMHGMDGYSVCRKIRADCKYQFTKIIMVSGHSRVDERLCGYEAGADDYFAKPFDIHELLAKVKVYTRLKHQEEVDLVKGDLLTLLTHETMTPLNGIIGCSEILLADSDLGAKHRELVTMIGTAGAKLNRFFQNAILLSKLKAGLALTKSIEFVAPLVENVVAESAMQYEEKEIQISVSGGKKISVEADWTLLRYALLSIIGNAMKFSPGGGHVAVNIAQKKDVCEIIVDDQGCGVGREIKERIFEEFSVLDVAHHSQGQGLSLAISQRICCCHGGDVVVCDNPAGT